MRGRNLFLKPLADQTLVITGATSGIGLCTARRAARSGASLFLIARDAEGLSDLCNEITTSGGRAAFAIADVGDQAALEQAQDKAFEAFGGYDTWINAAGVAIASPILDTPRNEHERLFQTNYWGTVNACTLAVHHLKTKGGAVIIVGSIAADIGTPVLGAYAASKHAVKGFVDSLRLELLADDAPISLTLVKPSGIGTPLGEHSADHMQGAVKIPPPAYPPESVAKSILYAVEHPRREMVIGGVGALQILGAVLTPRLADLISSRVGPLLVDKARSPSAVNNLFRPASNGAERSPFEWVLPGSLYSLADRRRRATAAIVGVLLGAFTAVLVIARPRRSRALPQARKPGARP